MEHTDVSNSTILIVDDTPDNLTVLTRILKQRDYSVRPAINGELALKAVQTSSPPDLILLDIMLPGMDGYEVCRRLKADDKTHDIPVLFISALDEMLDKVKAFEVGGVDYITKPFSTEEVLARVETHLRLRYSQKYLQEKSQQLEQEFTDRQQAEATLHHRTEELSLLSSISQVFSSSLDLENVLDMVLGEIQRLLAVASTSFWLIVPESNELICLRAKGAGSDNLVQWKLPLGKGITGWAAEHNESVVVADTWKDDRHFKDIDQQTGVTIRSMISIPLRVKGSVIGVLNLVDFRVNHFTRHELTLLEPIAAAAAVAIENARLYTTAQQELLERERAEQIQTSLYLISEAAQTTQNLDDLFPVIREIIGKLMPVENFYIAFYDAETEIISYPYYVEKNIVAARPPRPFGTGLAEYVLRTGQPLLLTPEYREELVKRGEMKPVFFTPTVVDWLGVPLKVDERIIGILTIRSHSQEVRLGEDEKNILLFVSAQIALAIERKRSEELLDKLQKAFATTEVGITITDPDGKIVYVNPAEATMHGYAVEELLGQPSNLFCPPELRHPRKEALQRDETFSNWKRECVNTRKDGSTFPVKLVSNPIYNKQGDLIGKVTICEDITDRKQWEQRLQESEECYRGIVENATTGIFQATFEGQFITINPALARMLGYASIQELLENITNIPEQLYVEPQHWSDVVEMIRTTQEAASVETRYRHRDGGELIINLNIWAVPDEHGQPSYAEGFVENITERKQMVRTLFQQAALLHSVAGAMNSLLVNPDFGSAITDALELLGFATEVDRISIFENYAHSDTGDMLMNQRFEWVKELSESQLQNVALQNLPYDPDFSRWYETLSAKKTISGFIRDFPLSERTMLEAQHIRSIIVVPIMLRDQFWGFIGFHACQTDRQWRPEEESILSAMAGSIGGAIARKHAEEDLIRTNNELQEILDDLQRTQTQLVRSEKLAALGQLIAGIAHEINTPLGAIRSAIGDISTTINETLEQLPEFLYALPEDHREAFFTLLKRAQQKNITLSSKQERQLKRTLVNMLNDLGLKHARKIGEMLVNIGVYDNIHPFLPLLHDPDHNRTLTMVYRLAGLQESTQTITTAVARASKVVFALKTYARKGVMGEMLDVDLSEGIETVLTLYHNQLKHGVEVIRNYTPLPPIPCYPDELNQVWTNLIHNALQAMDYKGALTITLEQQQDQTVVSISDTGKGIPEENVTRIFEPFFTTKPPGEGSGMGLDIVRKIIDKHHGTIHVESQPGNTTFFVRLPMRRET